MFVIVILGGLLAAGAGTFTGLLIAYNTSGGPKYTAQMFGQSLPVLSTLGVFCTGLALALIFCGGLWLLTHARRPPRAAASRAAAPQQNDTRDRPRRTAAAVTWPSRPGRRCTADRQATRAAAVLQPPTRRATGVPQRRSSVRRNRVDAVRRGRVGVVVSDGT